MKILITICARGGSKGVPGKNIIKLAGKHLIGYTIEQAISLQKIFPEANIALSTDSIQIKNVAKEYGLIYNYQRPESLALDNSGKLSAISDVLRFDERINDLYYDYIIDLDVTSPLRSIQDIKISFDQLKSNPEALNIFSVNKANRNPYFNMVEKNKNSDFVRLVKNNSQFSTRQEAPDVFDMNASFYIYRRQFFEEKLTSAITNFSLIYEMPGLCFDIDEPEDFHIMEALIKTGIIKIESK